MKYKIGDTIYWVESSAHYQKQIPCPMCFGKKFVTIILGDDSQEKIECGACQRGTERPSGFATVWEPSANILSGTITGVSTKDGIRYEVGYKTIRESEAFESDKEAEPYRLLKYEEEKSRADLWWQESFVNAKKKQIWSANYHRECIKREERTIEWHKYRLMKIKEERKAPRTEEKL